MQEDIRFLLYQSFHTTSNQEIGKITSTFGLLSLKHGFLQALVNVIYDKAVNEINTIAALIQLKSFVRRYWDGQREYRMQPEDKQFLVNTIFSVNKKVSENHKFVQLIKDIISLMGHPVFELIPLIVSHLSNGEDLRTCLNFLLGMVGDGRYRMDNNSGQDFNAVYPCLTNLIHRGQAQLVAEYNDLQHMAGFSRQHRQQAFDKYQQSELKFGQVMYLCVKLMTKTIQWTKGNIARASRFEWALVCINCLKNVNEVFKMKDIQEVYSFLLRGSEQFNYFHCRKWAVKYLESFLQHVLIYTQAGSQISTSTDEFYSDYWPVLTQVVKQLFEHKSTQKIRRLELHLVERMFRVKPRLMIQQFDCYMFTIIPTLASYSEEDFIMIMEHPAEFIMSEQYRTESSQNMRIFAASAWISILHSFCSYNHELSEETYNKCLQFSDREMSSNNLSGIYFFLLLCTHLRKHYNKIHYQRTKHQLLEISAQHIPTFLQRGYPLCQAKVIELFVQLQLSGLISMDQGKNIADYIHLIFFNNEYEQVKGNEFLRIKAIIAVGYIKSQLLQRMSDGKLKQYLQLYLEMMGMYELVEIMDSFCHFIKATGINIVRHTVKIIRSLSLTFRQSFEKPEDYQNKFLVNSLNQDATKQIYLKTLTDLCYVISPTDLSIKQALEEELVWLLTTLFTGDVYEGIIFQFHYHIIIFFDSFMKELRKNRLVPSPNLEFFLSILMLKLMGLPTQGLKQIKQNPDLSQVQKLALSSTNCQQELYQLEYIKILSLAFPYMPIHHNVNNSKQTANNIVESSFLEKVVLMIDFFYNEEEEVPTLEGHLKARTCTTILLLLLLEEHQSRLPDIVYRKIWKVIRLNQVSVEPESTFCSYNMQLLYLLVWSLGDRVGTVLEHTRNSPENFLLNVLEQENILLLDHQEDYQIELKRTVLGLSTILKMASVCHPMHINIKLIFDWLLYYTRQSQCFDNDYLQQFKIPLNKNEVHELSQPFENPPLRKSDSKMPRIQYQVSMEQREMEPNQVIDFSRLERNEPSDVDYTMEGFEKEDLYCDDNPTILDNTDQMTVFISALQFFQEKCPEGYNQMLQNRYNELINIMNELEIEPHVSASLLSLQIIRSEEYLMRQSSC